MIAPPHRLRVADAVGGGIEPKQPAVSIAVSRSVYPVHIPGIVFCEKTWNLKTMSVIETIRNLLQSLDTPKAPMIDCRSNTPPAS